MATWFSYCRGIVRLVRVSNSVELKSWEHVVRLDSGAGEWGGVGAHLLAAVAVVHAEEGGIVVES